MTVAAKPGEAPPAMAAASIGEGSSWLAPAAFAGIVLAVAGLYWPTTRSLLHEWLFDETTSYGHGPFIVLIALWLGIRAIRTHAAPATPELRPVFWFALCIASIAWLVSLRSGIQVAHQLLFPVIAWLMVRMLLGARISVLTLPPLLLIYSAIPLWHLAVPALQSTTVNVVGTMLRAVGISAFVDGDYVYIRNGAFHVEEGCAGLRYFVVGVTLGGVLGELRRDRWIERLWLLALAGVLALIANWVRVYTVVVVGYLTDMQGYLVRVEHVRFGWLVFALAMAAFLLIARRWIPAHGETQPARPVLPPAHAPAPAWSFVVAISLPGLLAGPAWSFVSPLRAAAADNVGLPAASRAGVAARPGCTAHWRPEFPGADRETLQQYGEVCAYVATYLLQYQDKELVGYYARLYDPASELIAQRVRDVGGREFNEFQLGGRERHDQLVWYAYVIGDRQVRRGIEAQLRYAAATLHGAPASSVLALSAPCEPDCTAARDQLTGFVADMTRGRYLP